MFNSKLVGTFMIYISIKFLVTIYENFFIYCSQRLAKSRFPTAAMLLLDTVQKWKFPKLTFIEVFVQTEGRPPKLCCRGETVSITYSECVFVALVFQHAKRMSHFVICCLSGSTIFFQITSWKAPFSEKKLSNINCRFWVSLQYCLKYFSF